MDQITSFALNYKLVQMFVITFRKYFTLSETESRKAFILYIIHKQNLKVKCEQNSAVNFKGSVYLFFFVNCTF